VDLTGVIFREMDGEEVEEVIDLEYEVLGSSAFVKLSTLPYYKKVIVADAGELAGCAVVYWDSETFRLGSIAVKEKYRRMGIGTELIKKCAEIAEKLGFDKIRKLPDPVRIASEGAVWGRLQTMGLLDGAVIVSDQQFSLWLWKWFL